MVELRCVLYGPLREEADRRSVSLGVDGDTVGAALRALVERHEGLAAHVFDDGALAADLVVTRNGRHVSQLDGLETPVAEGDVLRLTPAFYGG